MPHLFDRPQAHTHTHEHLLPATTIHVKDTAQQAATTILTTLPFAVAAVFFCCGFVDKDDVRGVSWLTVWVESPLVIRL